MSITTTEWWRPNAIYFWYPAATAKNDSVFYWAEDVSEYLVEAAKLQQNCDYAFLEDALTEYLSNEAAKRN